MCIPQLRHRSEEQEALIEELKLRLEAAEAEVRVVMYDLLHASVPLRMLMTCVCFFWQRDELREERETLVRNISCIFRTAQLELQRKDDQLKELRQQAEGIPNSATGPQQKTLQT